MHACIESTEAADLVSMQSSGHINTVHQKMSALSRKLYGHNYLMKTFTFNKRDTTAPAAARERKPMGKTHGPQT